VRQATCPLLLGRKGLQGFGVRVCKTSQACAFQTKPVWAESVLQTHITVISRHVGQQSLIDTLLGAGEMRVGGRDEQLYSCTHCQAPQFMVLLVTSKVHMQKNHMCKKGVATPSRMMLSRECRK